MTYDEMMEYIHPACKYATWQKRDNAHQICSGQIIDGKAIIKCHCECHGDNNEQ